MDSLEKPIRVAQRRLFVQEFLDVLGRALLWCLGIAAIAVVAAKFVDLPYEFSTWVMFWSALACGLAVVVSAVITILRRPNRVASATAVDKRMNLRERLSTLEQLTPELRQSPMGQALVDDTRRKTQGLDVRDSFPIKLNTHWAYTLVPTLVIALSFLFADPADIAAKTALEQNITVEQVKNSTETLLKQVRKQREAAEKDKLEDADFFKNLESKLEDLRSNPPKQEKQMLAELKKMQDRLEQKRQELGTGESLKKQLAGLKKLDDGPAEKLAESMKDGDMEEAGEQVQQMMEKLEKGELTKAEQEKLAEQLEQMSKALEEAAKEHEQQKKQLEEQIKKAEESGDSEKAAELSEKLNKMQQADADVKAMAEMAESLASAAESLKKGDQASTNKSLGEMKDKLGKMAQNRKQSEKLQELQEGLNNSKRASSCTQCSGGGCAECMSKSNQSGFKDFAKGFGRGGGKRDESADDTSDYDSQVRGNLQKGETAFGGTVGGENKKTPTQMDVRDAILSAEIEEPDPIEQAILPKRERDVSREYMDSIRKNE